MCDECGTTRAKHNLGGEVCFSLQVQQPHAQKPLQRHHSSIMRRDAVGHSENVALWRGGGGGDGGVAVAVYKNGFK